jgi:hypothetical protein
MLTIKQARRLAKKNRRFDKLVKAGKRMVVVEGNILKATRPAAIDPSILSRSTQKALGRGKAK